MDVQNKGNVTFQHSVKVPRLYKQAAAVAKDAEQGLGSIKQLVYEKRKKHPNIKALYALVATLYERRDEIDNLLKRAQFFTREPKADPWLTKILVVELIWGKKRLPGQSKPEETIRAYEQIFKAHLSDAKPYESESTDTKVDSKPRYVRVNTLKITLNEAIDKFRDEGWNLIKFVDTTNYDEFIDRITSLGEDEFMIDIHIPNLLIFPPKTQFYNHPAYKNGSIILQDKASCLPVHILAPNPESVALDMCAAPGMKTTHLAAVMNNTGTVYAIERNAKRFEVLNTIIGSSGATCVKTLNKDVLSCSVTDFPGVEYILVDPSCSGSGMTDRIAAKQGEDSRRFEKLTGFQILILRSALTRYPDAKRVVYSTCSIYPDENEDVVRQVLETNYKYKLVPARNFVNDTWRNFGSPDFGDIGKCCLYAKPDEDFTNGFFVAVFEKLGEDEENQFFNNRIFNYKKDVAIKEKRKKFREEREMLLEENSIAESGYEKCKKKAKYKKEMSENGTGIEDSNYEKNEFAIESRKVSHINESDPEKVEKKKKFKSGDNMEGVIEESNCIALVETNDKKKKKKKKEYKSNHNVEIMEDLIQESSSYHYPTEDSQRNEVVIESFEKKKKPKSKINIDAISIKNEDSENEQAYFEKQSEKKKKKRLNTVCNLETEIAIKDSEDFPDNKTERKKKKKHNNVETMESEDFPGNKTERIMKKKHNNVETMEDMEEIIVCNLENEIAIKESQDFPGNKTERKKKKKHNNVETMESEDFPGNKTERKKKKKPNNVETMEDMEEMIVCNLETEIAIKESEDFPGNKTERKKKKKHNNVETMEDMEEIIVCNLETEIAIKESEDFPGNKTERKKKKKHNNVETMESEDFPRNKTERKKKN